MKKYTKRVEGHIFSCADDVSGQFYQWVTNYLEDYNDMGKFISSPIEQLFYVEWFKRYFIADERDVTPFFLIPQYQDGSTGKYKIDFCVSFMDYLVNTGNLFDRYSTGAYKACLEPRLGIELDGHIWHEKTKEQVQYHKERERFLIKSGWKLLRFTGGEIYRDPSKAVEEMVEMARDLAGKWYAKLRRFDKKESE